MSLHDWHYIHRNIKPSNFTIQVDDVRPTIFLIDFGLAWQFHNPTTYLHTPYIMKHSIVGTLPFTSINCQQGCAQSHCDNLESLAYTIIFFAHGDLPWTSNSIFGDHKAVLPKKTSITAEELCKGLPPPFSKFVIYVCSLGFDKKPNYTHLHAILLQCLETDQQVLPFSAPPPGTNCMPCLGNRVWVTSFIDNL